MNYHTTRRFSHYLTLRSLLLILTASLAATFLGSCSLWIATESLFGSKLHMEVNVVEGANNSIPVAMSVVYVYDEDALNKLLAMSAQQWFETRAQLEESYHEQKALEVYDYEWVSGQDTAIALPYRASSVGAIIFANYFNDVQNRVRIDPYTNIVVSLGGDEVVVEPAQ